MKNKVCASIITYNIDEKIIEVTNSIINQVEYDNIIQGQNQIVADAISFYQQPKLLVNNPAIRYIYFLPKLHKDIVDWRTQYYHPKMRPIISDTNSITYNLSRYLLPHLQVIEQRITTVIPSSLALAHNINRLNKENVLFEKPLLATLDVESLFTRICQFKLLEIVNNLLIQYDYSEEARLKFMKYLVNIVRSNTFQVNGQYVLQNIGLPMGGPLSSCLANIYLSEL